MILTLSCSENDAVKPKLYSSRIDLSAVFEQAEINRLNEIFSYHDSTLNRSKYSKVIWAFYLEPKLHQNKIISDFRNLSELYYCPPDYYSYLGNQPIAIYSNEVLLSADSSDLRDIFASFINDDMIGKKIKEKIVLNGTEVDFEGIEPKHVTTTYEKQVWKFENGEITKLTKFELHRNCNFNRDISSYNKYLR